MKRIASILALCACLLARIASADTRIEAEAAKLGPGAQAVADTQASGGKCVNMGSPLGNARVDTPNPDAPQITCEFNIDTHGNNNITLRLLAPSDGTDSLYFLLDTGKPALSSVKSAPRWQDHTLVIRPLANGAHTLKLYTREPGLKIDSITIQAKGLDKNIVEQFPAPPILPPAEHPRVLMRKADFDTIRARRTVGENADAWKTVQELAASAVSGNLPEKSDGKYGNYDATATRAMRAKAFVYAIDGEENRGREAVQIALNFMRSVRFNSEAQDVTRPIGETIYSAAVVYDWCYPLLTDAQRKECIARMIELAGTMEIHYPPYGQSAITSHAGEAQLLRDILCAGIAVYDEHPSMYRMAAGRFFAEMVPARNFFYTSGRHHQGDSYGPYRYAWEVFAAWIFRRMAGVDVFSKDMADVPYAWIYNRRPDGQILRDGDTFLSGPDYWKFPPPLILTANYFNDPILKGELVRQVGNKAVTDQPVLFLLVNDPTLGAKPVDDLPLTRFRSGPLPAMQCRTGWGLGFGSPAVVAELKGASYQFNNHHHLDAGSFQIYYKGALAHDPGAYGKYGTPYDYAFNKRSIAHNMMLAYDPGEKFPRDMNDGGMRWPNGGSEPANLEVLKTKGYEVGSVLARAWGPNADAPLYNYMKIDITKGYSEKIAAYTRAFCFLNLDQTDHPAALIVLDDMRTARENIRKYWLLHVLEKPVITDGVIDVRRVEGPYGGRMVVNTLLPEKTQVELKDGPDGKVDVFGAEYETPKKADNSETCAWRIQMSPEKPATRDVFLNVMQVMDAAGVEPLPVKRLETAEFLGIAIADRTVYFAREAAPVNASVKIEVPAPGQVLVTGLMPGKWTVAATGAQPTDAHAVDAETGVLFFLAPASGAYTIAPDAPDSLPASPSRADLKATIRKASASIAIGKRGMAFETPFLRENDTPLIPIVDVLKTAGVEAKLDGKTLTAQSGDRLLTLTAGEKTYTVNTLAFDLPAPARIEDGKMLAPPQPIAGLLKFRFRDYGVLGDLQFYSPTGADDGALWIESARAEGAPSLNSPALAIDDDTSTFWSANANEVALELDLGAVAKIARVGASWYHGAERKAFFSIELSTDGKQWKRVWDGESSGKTVDLEACAFDAQTARFIRLVCRGNSQNKWNSLNEVKVYSK